MQERVHCRSNVFILSEPSFRLTQSLINVRSSIIYLINFLNLTSGQPQTDVQVVRQQNELGIPKRTTVSVEPCLMVIPKSFVSFLIETALEHRLLCEIGKCITNYIPYFKVGCNYSCKFGTSNTVYGATYAWQWAETLVEIRGTLADIRGTTK